MWRLDKIFTLLRPSQRSLRNLRLSSVRLFPARSIQDNELLVVVCDLDEQLLVLLCCSFAPEALKRERERERADQQSVS